MSPSPGRAIPSRPFATPKPATTRRTTHEVPQVLREALFHRCGGLCELCGERLPASFDVHHRKLRSRGGLDSITNTVALHRLCHQRVHGHPAWADEVGFMVASHTEPARVRLALHGETWVRLRADGSYDRDRT